MLLLRPIGKVNSKLLSLRGVTNYTQIFDCTGVTATNCIGSAAYINCYTDTYTYTYPHAHAHIHCTKENSETFNRDEYFIWARNKSLVNRETSNLRVGWSSEAWYYRMAYKERMRKLFNLYSDRLLQWGFPDSSGLVKSDYIIPFLEDSFRFHFSEAFTRNNIS